MYLQIFDGNFLVAVIKDFQVTLIESDTAQQGDEEYEGLMKLTLMDDLLVTFKGRYIGTYSPNNPDYLIGLKIVLEEYLNVFTFRLVIDESAEELISEIVNFPFERKWILALEVLKTLREVVGLQDDRIISGIIKTLEKNDQVRLVDFVSLMERFSSVFSDEEYEDEWKEAFITALFYLIPANPIETLRNLQAIISLAQKSK